MKNNFAMHGLLIVSLALSSCATIISHSNWPVSVRTNPEGANFVIKNKKGQEVYNSVTPAVLMLKSGSGYFGKESYTIIISKEGYKTQTVNLECKINGWYFGNIFIGGLLGMLIVDPLTGAMYRLENDEVFKTLSDISKSNRPGELSVAIMNKDEIPSALAGRLVKLVP